MQKVMITTATVAALVLSAGMSVAGPLGGNGKLGFTQDVRSSVAQAFDHQTPKMNDRSVDLTSKGDLAQTNSSLAQQNSTYGSTPSSELPNVVIIPIEDNGSYTWVIGKSSGPDLSPYPRLDYRW